MHVNDGLHLHATAPRTVEFVFSFDSLVHVEQNVIDSYLAEIKRILIPGGHAFLHHSNLGEFGDRWKERPLARGRTVDSKSVRTAAERIGLQVLCQELITWDSEGLRDCMTLLGNGNEPVDTHVILNPGFWPTASEQKRTIGAWQAAVAERT